MNFKNKLVFTMLMAPVYNLACADSASDTTTLIVKNATSEPVPVMITLGSNNGINNISQLPQIWKVKQAPSCQPNTDCLQGSFILQAHQSVSYNSTNLSFSGNISFGPSWTAPGCGGQYIPNTNQLSCYPNATSLAEFSLNMGTGNDEAVDISGVNGTNALITINFKKGPPWNDGTNPVSTIQNVALPNFNPTPGVYGWGATNCTYSQTPPNPTNGCPAPLTAPNHKNGTPIYQLQTVAQCNIQRQGSGGVVEIVFNGYTPGSTPPAGCDGAATGNAGSSAQK